MPISHTGIAFYPSIKNTNLMLKDVLHVPSLCKPLLSVQKFSHDNHCFFEFYPSYFLVKDLKSKEILLQGTSNAGLYAFFPPKPRAFLSDCVSFDTWHARLWHPHVQTISHMIKDNKLPSSGSFLRPFN